MRSLVQKAKYAAETGVLLAGIFVGGTSISDLIVYSNRFTPSQPNLEQALASSEFVFISPEQQEIYEKYNVIVTNNPFNVPRDIIISHRFLVDVISDTEFAYRTRLLKTEIQNYNPDFIRKTGLHYVFIGDNIILFHPGDEIKKDSSGKLSVDNGEEYGGIIQNRLDYCTLHFIPFLSSTSVIYLSWPNEFHHELYHLMDSNFSCRLNLSEWPKGGDIELTEKKTENKNDLEKKVLAQGYLTQYSGVDEGEDKANIFALLVSERFDSDLFKITGKSLKEDGLVSLRETFPIVGRKMDWMGEYIKQLYEYLSS